MDIDALQKNINGTTFNLSAYARLKRCCKFLHIDEKSRAVLFPQTILGVEGFYLYSFTLLSGLLDLIRFHSFASHSTGSRILYMKGASSSFRNPFLINLYKRCKDEAFSNED